MTQKNMLRSTLQVAVLCLAAFVLTTATTKATEWDCEAEAATCSSMCGSTVTSVYQYTGWDPWCEWNETTQSWEGCPYDVYEYEWGSGVENFECDEASEYSVCVCAY